MPGSNAKMLAKSVSLKVDTICMDLEDAVAPNKKVEARHNIVNALSLPITAERCGNALI
jgi:citrate lyase beta subunit